MPQLTVKLSLSVNNARSEDVTFTEQNSVVSANKTRNNGV